MRGRGVAWLTVVLTLGLVTACGKGTVDPVKDPSDFLPYFQKFQTYAGQYGNHVPQVVNFLAIGFGPTEDADVAGFCELDFLRGRHITINQDEWNQLDSPSREVLVFHELGHCALNRQHMKGNVQGTDAGATDSAEYPKSLMNPILVAGDVYLHLQSYYLTELFANAGI